MKNSTWRKELLRRLRLLYFKLRKQYRMADVWNTPERFIEWAQSTRPDMKRAILVVVNSNQSCGPDNCLWRTPIQAAYVKKNTRVLEFGGEAHSLGQWAKIIGITRQEITYRLEVLKWPVYRALSPNKWENNRKVKNEKKGNERTRSKSDCGAASKPITTHQHAEGHGRV